MRRIRVVIGDMQSSLLRDILAHMTRLDPELELVPAHPSLEGAIAEGHVDVVISEMRSGRPPEADVVFGDPNAPVFVGLAHEGREATVCVANPGAAQLVALIRNAVRGAGEP